MKIIVLFVGCYLLLNSCNNITENFNPITTDSVTNIDSIVELSDNPDGDSLPGKQAVSLPHSTLSGGPGADTADAAHILNYAYKLYGKPYKYASADPMQGFDCSGFLYYVFEHFNIDVPRSSRDYMLFGKEVPSDHAMPGDLILFTGTDSTNPECGHVGIITKQDKGDIRFIHSSSGKANGVTISPLQGYYRTRYLKCIRILKKNDSA
jgi:cell wall-associated NlpC family hydrolase